MRSTRVLFATGAGALLMAGVAMAQPAPGPNADAPPPPRPGREGPGRDGPGHEGPGREGHRGEMGGPGRGGWMRRMMEDGKAARFELRRGDMHIDIKCAADEPMKACVDAATQLLDRVAPK